MSRTPSEPGTSRRWESTEDTIARLIKERDALRRALKIARDVMQEIEGSNNIQAAIDEADDALALCEEGK